jgi:hypothetical protein
LPLQIAAEIIAASKIAKTLADLDGAGTDVEFAVLFRMVEIWRAGWDKTTNTYVIDVACAFRRQRRTGERAVA